MKVESNGYEHASEIAKAKAMMHDETGKLGKGTFVEEKTNESVEPAAIIDSPSEEESAKQLFTADVKDEIIAVENNETLEEDIKLSAEKVIENAVSNISAFAEEDPANFQLAITLIEDSMIENPNNANEIKQGIIDLLKEQTSLLPE